LDYFYAPNGWTSKWWREGLFRNLIQMVKEQFFYFGNMDDCIHVKERNFVDSPFAVIYLPFCRTCLNFISLFYEEFEKMFTIRFMKRDELAEHVLWKSLNQNKLLYDNMKTAFDKEPNQEQLFGKLDSFITSRLSQFEVSELKEFRFIKLMVLRNISPDFNNNIEWPKECDIGISKGGYVF